MKEYTGVDLIDRMFNDAKPRTDNEGNEIREIFHSAERYLFDFNIDYSHWIQFDTENDAWYFGVWVSKERLCVLSYVEGDISFVQCPDAEHYDAKMAKLCEFYQPGAHTVAIDGDGNATHYYQNRIECFIDPSKCPPSPIKFANEDELQDTDGNSES